MSPSVRFKETFRTLTNNLFQGKLDQEPRPLFEYNTSQLPFLSRQIYPNE